MYLKFSMWPIFGNSNWPCSALLMGNPCSVTGHTVSMVWQTDSTTAAEACWCDFCMWSSFELFKLLGVSFASHHQPELFTGISEMVQTGFPLIWNLWSMTWPLTMEVLLHLLDLIFILVLMIWWTFFLGCCQGCYNVHISAVPSEQTVTVNLYLLLMFSLDLTHPSFPTLSCTLSTNFLLCSWYNYYKIYVLIIWPVCLLQRKKPAFIHFVFL